LRQHLHRKQTAWKNIAGRFDRLHPATEISRYKEILACLVERLRGAGKTRTQIKRERMASAMTRLELLGPDNVLKRGYSITTDAASGRVLREASEVKKGTEIRTRLAHGEVKSTVH
jgi:exodeoxyribonuclease VII large subunit